MSSNILDRANDRMVADLVNDLTKIGKKYQRSQQLRENVSQRVDQFRREYAEKQVVLEDDIISRPRVITQLVVARDICGAIGKTNGLPWEQNTDMKYFRRATISTVVIMGRNTFESMGYKPLQDRFNIVITSKKLITATYRARNLAYVETFEEAVRLATIRARELYSPNARISIIGGATLYRTAMESGIVDVIRETLIMASAEDADTYFNPSSYMAPSEWDQLASDCRFDTEKDQHTQYFRVFARSSKISEADRRRLLLTDSSYT